MPMVMQADTHMRAVHVKQGTGVSSASTAHYENMPSNDPFLASLL